MSFLGILERRADRLSRALHLYPFSIPLHQLDMQEVHRRRYVLYSVVHCSSSHPPSRVHTHTVVQRFLRRSPHGSHRESTLIHILLCQARESKDCPSVTRRVPAPKNACIEQISNDCHGSVSNSVVFGSHCHIASDCATIFTVFQALCENCRIFYIPERCSSSFHFLLEAAVLSQRARSLFAQTRQRCEKCLTLDLQVIRTDHYLSPGGGVGNGSGALKFAWKMKTWAGGGSRKSSKWY